MGVPKLVTVKLNPDGTFPPITNKGHGLGVATSYASPESMAEDRVDALEYRVKWLSFRQWVTAASVLLIGIILLILVRT